MAVFLVTVANGPAWDGTRSRREQAGWDEHAAFMDRLVDDGLVVLGGPVGDGDRVVLAVQAADESEVEARLSADPWRKAGVIVDAAVEPWSLWLDGRRR